MRKTLHFCSTAFVLVGISFPAFAWGPDGHRQIADLAWVGLKNKARIEVTAILQAGDISFQPTAPYSTAAVRNAFREAATLPDDIKGNRFTIYESLIPSMNSKWHPETDDRVAPSEKMLCKSWHYYDTPILYSGERPNKVPNSNAAVALPYALSRLRLMEMKPYKTASDRKLQSWWLAWIEHLVGDLHQPLHCAESFQYSPEGDAGGNLFKLKKHPQDKRTPSLHAYWDGGIDRAKAREKKETGASSNFEVVTRRWLKQNGIELDSPDAQNLDINSWIASGAWLAKNNVYTGIAPDEDPSEEYIKGQQVVVEQQAVLAGRRLSNLLNDIFSSS